MMSNKKWKVFNKYWLRSGDIIVFTNYALYELEKMKNPQNFFELAWLVYNPSETTQTSKPYKEELKENGLKIICYVRNPKKAQGYDFFESIKNDKQSPKLSGDNKIIAVLSPKYYMYCFSRNIKYYDFMWIKEGFQEYVKAGQKENFNLSL